MPDSRSVSTPGASSLAGELARQLLRQSPCDGVFATAIPGLSAIKFSRPTDELAYALHQPAVCIIAQGAKRVMLREEMYQYDSSRFLVFSTDLPISAQVTHASASVPYLCFRFDLDPVLVSDLALKMVAGTPSHRSPSSRGLFLSEASDDMLDAALRLMRLLDAPADAAALAPLVSQELIYRLLRSEQGERLANAVRSGSNAQRVTRAIGWLKAHFTEPLRIEDLARDVHMSSSSLHHHFRAVTAMSPLQYQKQLRLQEARRLLLAEGVEVTQAGYAVGYESASQFSREYSRLFGVPPSQDARARRGGKVTAVD
jgi:AraC-like DNA-binding protein